MSSRFLAKGHNNRPPSARVPSSRSPNPPVSKVQPLTLRSESEDGIPVSLVRTETVPEKDPPLKPRPVKKRTPESHLWRMSNPPPKGSPLLDRTACMQKSQSALNLATAPRSPLPSSVQKETCPRPQHLLPTDSPTTSTPSSVSPHSPVTPPPWESPKLKQQHSYMNPTASSMAKSSRSSSLGDELQSASPPRSHSFPENRSSSEEMEPPVLSSSPVLTFPSKGPSLVATHPTAAVSPTRLTQSAPASRIPLLKQPLSPRSSLCLEVKPGPGCSGVALRASASTADVGSDVGLDVSPSPGKASARCRQLSLTYDPTSSLITTQQRNSISESAKEGGQEAKERPLVPEENQTQNPQSVTLETCRESITNLHISLRKTILLFTTLLKHDQTSSEGRREMLNVVSEALLTVKAELDSLPLAPSLRGGSQGLKGEGDKALALLEQYAELLLKSVERRLDAKN
ncbi:proline-rich receptor-like protein kinase PERK10 [Nothobranchius furzeri]|uniref:Proline-rich receptor-like protein kinase PERK10 n=4 Tax=Nothobranchius furzeri TaxID=105023 RepID=A0A9D2Z3K1_NOTFU|nr:proline-rich receptor-like protein kinase PERK10 [Nothobranchius furzeri]